MIYIHQQTTQSWKDFMTAYFGIDFSTSSIECLALVNWVLEKEKIGRSHKICGGFNHKFVYNDSLVTWYVMVMQSSRVLFPQIWSVLTKLLSQVICFIQCHLLVRISSAQHPGNRKKMSTSPAVWSILTSFFRFRLSWDAPIGSLLTGLHRK